jgi:hypothetical protein
MSFCLLLNFFRQNYDSSSRWYKNTSPSFPQPSLDTIKDPGKAYSKFVIGNRSSISFNCEGMLYALCNASSMFIYQEERREDFDFGILFGMKCGRDYMQNN